MNAASTLVLIALAIPIFVGSRRSALLALVAGAMFLGQGVSFNIGLNIYPMRLLALVAFLRVLKRREMTFSGLNELDRAFIGAYGFAVAVYLIRTALGYGTSETISQTSNLSKLGGFCDMFLGYFAFRGLLRGADDLKHFLIRFPLLLLPYVGSLAVERMSGTNPLGMLGGPPYMWLDVEGRARCFGTFTHPSLLGTFGASFLLLYVHLFFERSARMWATIAIGLCLAIVGLANSGSPVSFLALGLGVWALWPLRRNVAVLKAGLGIGLLITALAMNSPIWYLPTRISGIIGGSGWHRSYLMERGFADIDKWWLAGMPLDLTVSWFPYVIMDAADMTNLFLQFGVDGGLLAMLLLILALVLAFRRLGRAMVAARQSPDSRLSESLLWALSAVLIAHIINFFAITYFDQFNMIWMMQMAAISGVTAEVLKRSQERDAAGAPPAVEQRPGTAARLKGRRVAREIGDQRR
jgi:hypothetical protein